MNRGGFTLMELMVAIAIVFIVSMSVYIPYSHYQKKAEFNLTIKQVVQLLSQARSSSIYGDSEQTNRSFGVYLESGSESIKFLSYPYNATGSIVLEGADITVVKDMKFPKNVQMNAIGEHDNSLLLYEAISGKLSPYYFDGSGVSYLYETIPNIIEIGISYGSVENPVFAKTLRYYTSTHIIDY